VNLGKAGYMEPIIAGTKDILPTLIFNNAGYVQTGLFSDSPLESLLANYECNATAPINVTHHFVQRILAESNRTVAQRRGGIFFTSSPAGVMPCPTTVMYGASKAFLTEFATSLSAEIFADGLDTLVVHPSPVDTGFYSGNKHDMSAMKLFQRTATSPETIAACFFKSAGRTVVCDQGYFSIALRLMLKVIDYNAISFLITRTSTMSGDYVKLVGQRKKKE
jgi:short-subunit dehydrogenase